MKTTTDLHWNDRAASVERDIEVNIMDVFQRELEYDAIVPFLRPDMTILEVGCGNGFSTERFRQYVKHVDAFDYAENMVARAKERVGETNNTFFHDNVLQPTNIDSSYDAVVCVRVLINLAGLDEQLLALENMARFVSPGGLLILVEGFTEGFTALTAAREAVALPAIEPAAINFYSSIHDIMPVAAKQFNLEETFHLGAYDYLTRVVYPAVAGIENVRHNTVFSERCSELARAFNPSCFDDLSRIKGLVFRKKQ